MGKISSQQIKDIRSLAAKKYRDERGLFVVEGEKMVEEARRCGLRIEQVWYRDEIGDEAMSRITQLNSPSPVLAVVRKPEDLHATAPDPEKGLFLALDAIRDPGNLGTIIRVAEWFGVDGIFASEDTVDLFNPKVVQATMGAIFRVPFHYTDLPALALRIRARKGQVYGTFLDGKNLYDRDLSNGMEAPSLVVTGNESHGISPAVAAVVTDRLYIPPFPPDDPGSESLNAAVATAITLAEFRRRTL